MEWKWWKGQKVQIGRISPYSFFNKRGWGRISQKNKRGPILLVHYFWYFFPYFRKQPSQVHFNTILLNVITDNKKCLSLNYPSETNDTKIELLPFTTLKEFILFRIEGFMINIFDISNSTNSCKTSIFKLRKITERKIEKIIWINCFEIPAIQSLSLSEWLSLCFLFQHIPIWFYPVRFV